MYKVILLIVLDAVILQPIRLILGFLARFTWIKPKVDKYFINSNNYIKTYYNNLVKKIPELVNRLDKNKYGLDDDSAKFLGMLYAALYLDYRLENNKFKEQRENFLRLVTEDGKLKRNLKEPYPEDCPDFSTDMLSGFMLGVYASLQDSDKTEEGINKLAKVWDNCTFKKFPLLVDSYKRGKKLFGRGHVYRFWWVLGCEEILMALTWLMLGYKVTNQKRYLVCYKLLKWLELPSLLLTCPDAQIKLGNIIYLSAHNTHSRLLINFVGHELTGSYLFKRAIKVAYKRHGEYNADVRVIALNSLPLKDLLKLSKEKNIKKWKINTCNLILNTLNKGLMESPKNMNYLVLSLPPKIKKYSKNIPTPTFRGNDYIWERNPLYGYVYDNKTRKKLCLDIIFPVCLLDYYITSVGYFYKY